MKWVGTENLAYENFKSSNCSFYLGAVPTATGNAILTPEKYGNISGEPYLYDYEIYGLPMR